MHELKTTLANLIGKKPDQCTFNQIYDSMAKCASLHEPRVLGGPHCPNQRAETFMRCPITCQHLLFSLNFPYLKSFPR